MSPTRIVRALILPAAAWLLAAGWTSPAHAGDGCCGRGVFCPVHVFCRSKTPCILWWCTCPNKVCDPCTLAQHGYHFPSWTPWSPPACGTPPANGMVFTGQGPNLPQSSYAATAEPLPEPRRMDASRTGK
jgi:hypothetical protein